MFMRMVSPSWSIFLLLQMVSHPKSLAEQFPNVYEDGVPSWSWHQNYERGEGTSDIARRDNGDLMSISLFLNS